MRVIVCGSRHWPEDYLPLLRKIIVGRLFDLPVTSTVVNGYAKGVDRIAHQEAEKLGLIVEPHRADWNRYRKAAGVIRNEKMAELGADLCIAFWDGRSNGTADMMERAEKHGILVEKIMLP